MYGNFGTSSGARFMQDAAQSQARDAVMQQLLAENTAATAGPSLMSSVGAGAGVLTTGAQSYMAGQKIGAQAGQLRPENQMHRDRLAPQRKELAQGAGQQAVMGAGGGAMAGGTAGSAFGPGGTAVGGLIGALLGAAGPSYGAQQADPQEAKRMGLMAMGGLTAADMMGNVSQDFFRGGPPPTEGGENAGGFVGKMGEGLSGGFSTNQFTKSLGGVGKSLLRNILPF